MPENPAPESLEEQTEKALNPTTLAGGAAASGSEGPSTLERPKSVWEVLQGRTSLSAPGSTAGLRQAAGPDLALFKEVKNHELSVEQQLFYREITEACVGSSEEKRLQVKKFSFLLPFAMKLPVCGFPHVKVSFFRSRHSIVSAQTADCIRFSLASLLLSWRAFA